MIDKLKIWAALIALGIILSFYLGLCVLVVMDFK